MQWQRYARVIENNNNSKQKDITATTTATTVSQAFPFDRFDLIRFALLCIFLLFRKMHRVQSAFFFPLVHFLLALLLFLLLLFLFMWDSFFFFCTLWLFGLEYDIYTYTQHTYWYQRDWCAGRCVCVCLYGFQSNIRCFLLCSLRNIAF